MVRQMTSLQSCLRIFPLFATVMLAVMLRDARAEVKYGYVTVIGEGEPGVVHDDRGPHPAIMGEVFRNSAATSVSTGSSPASIDPFIETGRTPIAWAHRNMDASNIQVMADRGVHHYVFENEPDGRGGNWPQDYMDGLIPTYALIHSVDPEAVVIGGNLFSNQYDSLYQLGFKDYCDMVGFHCYSDDPATGIDIMAVVGVRNTMVAWGDGGKLIYLGEGWGPKRELRELPRLSPEIESSGREIELLRDFVVNGYRNIITPQGGYEPAWIFGVHFFTLNDNWGMFHWRDRAVPVYDGQGNLLYYLVDGYNVGNDIDPHFHNGGLIDYYGNAKDNLMDIFPGNGFSVSNAGFEYYDPFEPAVASMWVARGAAAEGTYVVDRSIYHGGRRSQRIDLVTSTEEYVYTDTVPDSVSPGSDYTGAAWVKCENVTKGGHTGARVGISFYDGLGNPTGSTTWSSGLGGTTDWSLISVTTQAAPAASYARLTISVSADSGVAWFDDVVIQPGTSLAPAAFSGYVLDQDNLPIAGALVALATSGYQGTTDGTGRFTITGIQPGVYDATASQGNFSTQLVRAQVAEPDHTNTLGFALEAIDPTNPTNIKCWNPEISGTLRISWTAPTGAHDYFRVYRSEMPLERGDLVHDNVPGSPLWDEGLSDGTKYYYTVRAVSGGAESQNEDRKLGIPTGGQLEATYDCSAPAIWPWSTSFGQTFRATSTGSLVNATCITAGTSGVQMTFQFRQSGPGGALIGPPRSLTTSRDVTVRAKWQTGEVPVQEDATYYLELTASGSTGIYASQTNAYPDGQMYIGGSPSGNDLWSTITLVTPHGVLIDDVTTELLPDGQCVIRWHTEVPSTSQAEYGLTRSYGNLSVLDPSLVKAHEVILSQLNPDVGYHFRVLSTRPGIPDAASPNYVFGGPISTGPFIEVWPQEVATSAQVLTDPQASSFNVSKSGTGIINYTITPGCSWLSVDPDAGTSSGEVDSITITYDTTGLEAGVYECLITVEAPEALNSPVLAPVVTLTLTTVAPDFDGDGDVDQEDFGHLQACLNGAGTEQNDPTCTDAKLDDDVDVDQDDFVIFQRCMSGANVPADPNCAS